jgi:hypothetical protein
VLLLEGFDLALPEVLVTAAVADIPIVHVSTARSRSSKRRDDNLVFLLDVECGERESGCLPLTNENF